MTRQEFESLTKHELASDEIFWFINELYLKTEYTKPEFCKLFMKMDKGLKNGFIACMQDKYERLSHLSKAIDEVSKKYLDYKKQIETETLELLKNDCESSFVYNLVDPKNIIYYKVGENIPLTDYDKEILRKIFNIETKE